MKNAYEELGGESVLRQLVQQFYHFMSEMPEARGIRQMHQHDLGSAEEKLFEFLSGWLGGPQLFMEKYGHPKLRFRHLPFAIGKSERDQWMLCMVAAMDAVKIEEPLRSQLLHNLLNLADHMRNQNGTGIL